MFEVNKRTGDRVDLTIAGKIDAEQMSEALDALMADAQGMRNGRMLYQIHDIDWPTLGAVAVELSRLPALLRLIGRFERIALVADEAWIRKAGEWEGALLPGVTIKGFHAIDDAEAWLAGGSDGTG